MNLSNRKYGNDYFFFQLFAIGFAEVAIHMVYLVYEVEKNLHVLKACNSDYQTSIK